MALPDPEFTFTRSRRHIGKQDSFPSAIQRLAIGEKRLRSFRLLWKNASRAQVDQVAAEFSTAKGAAATFSWTPVDEGSPVTVRFADDSFSWRWKSGNAYEMEVVLDEELF